MTMPDGTAVDRSGLPIVNCICLLGSTYRLHSIGTFLASIGRPQGLRLERAVSGQSRPSPSAARTANMTGTRNALIASSNPLIVADCDAETCQRYQPTGIVSKIRPPAAKAARALGRGRRRRAIRTAAIGRMITTCSTTKKVPPKSRSMPSTQTRPGGDSASSDSRHRFSPSESNHAPWLAAVATTGGTASSKTPLSRY